MNNNTSIIVITVIVLASIVVFNGLGTPDTANFASFAQQVDDACALVFNEFLTLKAQYAIYGEHRTDEQIYIEVATNEDPGQYAVMGIDKVIKGTSLSDLVSKEIQHIEVDKSNSYLENLPKIRQHNDEWYITKEGHVFNATGFIYDGKTYFTASVYCEKELPAEIPTNSNRAEAIGKAMLNKQSVVLVNE